MEGINFLKGENAMTETRETTACLGEGPELLERLRQRVASLTRELPASDALIEAELQGLYEVREAFIHWLSTLLASGTRISVNPAQFLRAWNDSVGRIIQLLRVRQSLLAETQGELAEVVESVYDLIDKTLAAMEVAQSNETIAPQGNDADLQEGPR